ncbi:MAG: histone deacetylase [candidate division Zixibacteria bacterium]|nr:histone deacetylase [candidate division Zixibacteria bacterium]
MNAESATGWVYSPEFLEHKPDSPHPECPDRLIAIINELQATGILAQLQPIEFGEATREEILRVHSSAYLEILDGSGGRYLDPETYAATDSPHIAKLAAGGVLAAARAVWNGRLANAFCAVRPPGHHAMPDRAMGFCLLNNIAIAAAGILADFPGARVLILDWDVHHGNGTQAMFYESPDVLYASVHQYPFYPGSGAAIETGRGRGKGFTVNFPLRAGAGDHEFLVAIDEILETHAAAFAPNLVLVSAGFDAHEDDPLANLRVSTEGFVQATRRVCAFADRTCGGKIVSVLEGGYHLTALAQSGAAHISELMSWARKRGESADSQQS